MIGRVTFCFLCLLFCCSWKLSAQMELEELSLIGREQGIDATSSFSQENLLKVLSGVEKGNRESIYTYGLLKLYGLSVHKDPVGAAQQFQRASALGHREATTAYGVMMMTGSTGEKNFGEAVKYFREGVAKGDLVSVSSSFQLYCHLTNKALFYYHAICPSCTTMHFVPILPSVECSLVVGKVSLRLN